MKKNLSLFIIIATLMAMLSGCVRETADENIPKIGEADRLVVFTSHKPEVYEPIIREFEKTTSIWVEVVSGGTNELLERLRESGSYEADVMFGGGVESLGAFADCFESYESSEAGALESEYASKEGMYTVFSSLPIVIVYNDKLVYRPSAPAGFADLLDERWKGKIAFADPGNSGTSYTALASIMQVLEGDRYENLRLFSEAVQTTVGGSGDVISAVNSGTKLVGITLEEYALKNKASGLDIGIVYPEEGTSAIPDGVALIKGARNPGNAKKFIDYVVSRNVQQYIADNFYRRSVRSDVKSATGQGLVAVGELPETIDVMNYDLGWASAHQGEILKKWKDLMD
ncbi:MAG: extracellular solute-binding protein [Lachnospiraceae bacterium]|nr:extracellular solute-binding protein [Lachnospiraceae bacterium]